jgi:hypothetical protein
MEEGERGRGGEGKIALFGQCPVWPMPCLANAQGLLTNDY